MKLYKIICIDVDEYNQPYEYEEDNIWTVKENAEKYCEKQNTTWDRCRVKEFYSAD